MLAGDILRSAADLQVPLVAVTLIYDKGYFFQDLDNEGNQREYDFEWDYNAEFTKMDKVISIPINGRDVKAKAWFYPIIGQTGHIIPVFLLDTNLPENDEEQKNYTNLLYDATPRQRLIQEAILGIGGVKMLDALGYNKINIFHMNEGHSALLTTELEAKFHDLEEVKKRCVFTTHTPVPAGHDRFDFDLVESVMGSHMAGKLREWGEESGRLNMTHLALHFSGYVNGVSRKHGDVSNQMFPNHDIDYITNGVHIPTWLHPRMRELYHRYLPPFEFDVKILENASAIESDELWNNHWLVKKKLLEYVRTHSWVLPDENLFTIGFARRITAYKRPTLLFSDIDRLGEICQGRAQIVMAGKTHPRDEGGRQLIKDIFQASRYLWERYKVRLVFLENYNMEVAKQMVSGVDIWLNTPRRYMEASGTSGMKASLNGVPNFSVLDGWWIEGFEMSKGAAGWAIGPGPEDPSAEGRSDQEDAEEIYDKLENEILPLYYINREQWIDKMRASISLGAYFNTRRVDKEYAVKAWGLTPQKRWRIGE